MYYNTETGETNQKPKIRIENGWDSKANDFLVLVRRSFFSAEDDSEQLRHANENKTLLTLALVQFPNSVPVIVNLSRNTKLRPQMKQACLPTKMTVAMGLHIYYNGF